MSEEKSRTFFPGCNCSDDEHVQAAREIELQQQSIWNRLVAEKGDLRADETILNECFRLVKEGMPNSNLTDISMVLLKLRLRAFEVSEQKYR